MVDTTTLENEPPEDSGPKSVGWYLRKAREEKGLSLEQVAAETRISKRHIEHIEEGKFDSLPARAYALGFSRSLAKTVGLDPAEVVAMVRTEMHDDHSRDRHTSTGAGTFEPGDPTRAPGSRLVWFSLFAVVLLLVGIFFAARVFFSPAAELPSLTQSDQGQEAAGQAVQTDVSGSAATPATASGPVVFTATGAVWVRFYDAQDRVLTERTLAEGESYTVPADAVGPKIITGRPDLLTITVGGQAVPPLSTELVTVQDVDVSAAGLLARAAPAPATPDVEAPAGAAN